MISAILRGAGLLATLALSAAAFPAAALPAAAHADDALAPYLPKSGTIEGHVMRLEVAPEDQALNQTFRVAVQNNMDWFKKYVSGSKPGPLPYNPKMGVTAAQYDKLQHLQADFQPGDPITITVRKTADGGIAFASKAQQAEALTNVTFPAGATKAETPFGALSIFNAIHQTDARAPIGVWDGAEWARVQDGGMSEPSAKIAFGKRVPSGEGVMYYQVSPYKGHAEQSLVVFYKLD